MRKTRFRMLEAKAADVGLILEYERRYGCRYSITSNLTGTTDFVKNLDEAAAVILYLAQGVESEHRKRLETNPIIRRKHVLNS